MEKEIIRLLKAEEIECRVSTINAKGLGLILYKDARVDQRILDETFGPFGWKRSHQCIDGNLYCTVEVYDVEHGEWVAKQDVGTTGYAEKEKSQASDSFKRACFNWGIGRELYSAPFIWIPAGKANIKEKEGRFTCSDRFSVHSIGYNENREITELEIMNGSGFVVYSFRDGAVVRGEEQTAAAPELLAGTSGSGTGTNAGKRKSTGSEKNQNLARAGTQARGRRTAGSEQSRNPAKANDGAQAGNRDGVVSKQQMDLLEAELERTGVAMEAVKDRYRIQEPGKMPKELYDRVMAALAKTKTMGVA